ncbi:MAG TPA: GNAT family N-acetyltransferase [Verrucomicrobiae bacterium]
MNPPPHIRFITAEETLPLRSVVLREGRPFDQCRFAEDGQPGSFHNGGVSNGQIAAIASWYPKALDGHDGRGFQLRGMAVAPDLQRSGIGHALLVFGEQHVRDHDLADFLWCNARVSAVPFYERNGWTVIGAEFEIPEVGPHRKMVKRLRG